MSISSQHISEYLFKNKVVSLEKIGVFDLNQKDDKDIFTYDKYAETSPEFIQYLVETLNKPFSIASQDLAYFLHQSRELMNIRASSMVIPGVGLVSVNNRGKYIFSSGSEEAGKESDKKAFSEAYAKNPLTSGVDYSTKNKSRKVWRWIAFIVVLGGIIAYAAYYVHSNPSFSFNDSRHDSKATVSNDTATESTTNKTNNNTQEVKTLVAQSRSFKFVIQTFPDEASCEKRRIQLKGFGNIVDRDTVTSEGKLLYRLYIKNTTATSADTARIRDSLSVYFGHPVTIE